MHPADNVAIVANDGGLPAGTVLPSGLTLLDKVPQAHKVALVDIPEGGEVRRYNVIIGYALKPIAAGSWVHERLLQMPEARSLRACPSPPSSRPCWSRWQAIPSRATAMRTARWARATSWPSPPRCNAWPGCSTLRCAASSPSCCPATPM
jgi:hypothetical protein